MPNFDLENSLGGVVAGIDVAGRGPLCGPVFAACVFIKDKNNFPKDIDDSKKISEKKREKIFEDILEYKKNGLLFFGFAKVEATIIDKVNIREATKLAMAEAYNNLAKKCDVDHVLVDGNFIPSIDVDAIAIVKGDQKSYSIACASIIAKVLRDHELITMDKKYPMYNFIKNKGYGTKEHIEAIKRYGLIAGYHRVTFCKHFTIN